MRTEYLNVLKRYDSFSRKDLLSAMIADGTKVSEAMFKVFLKKLLDSGEIVRVGRNAYCVGNGSLSAYHHDYSKQAREIAEIISNDFPYLSFSIMELIQLNLFVNHQIAHNIFFLSVESSIGDFVFDNLKNKYPGKVLIYPTIEIYNQYSTEDMIVIEKLVSESPSDIQEKWHTRIEKMLVDLLTDPILMSSVSESEYSNIYENAFERYVVDESCLFRYARRRGADKKIKQFIREKTTIKLRTERE